MAAYRCPECDVEIRADLPICAECGWMSQGIYMSQELVDWIVAACKRPTVIVYAAGSDPALFGPLARDDDA